MWCPLTFNADIYLVKALEEPEAIQFYFTNLKNMYFETLTTPELLQRFQELNPAIDDIKLENVKKEVIDLFQSNLKCGKVEFLDDDNKIDFHVEKSLSDNKNQLNFSVEFHLNLTKDKSNDLFLSEYSAPALKTINYLLAQQKVLMDLLKKKDRELQEYQMEKGEITRKDLVTDKFDFDSLHRDSVANTDLLLDVFKNEDFNKLFTELFGPVQLSIKPVKLEPWNDNKRKRLRKVYCAEKVEAKKMAGIHYKDQ